jgi:hypothetical protein
MVFDAPHAPNIAGVYGLKEYPTGSTLSASLKTEMLGAVQTPDIMGYCARIHIDQLFPSNNGVLVTTFLEQLYSAIQTSTNPNCKLAIRVITGRYTPSYVFSTLGARGYPASGGNGTAPDPCNTDGTPNTIYINWIVDCMSKIADWMRSKGPGRCPLLHWSWFANQYSEFYHGREVRSSADGGDNRAGYNTGSSNFIAASNLLVDAAYAESDTNITCSFGMSGTHTEDVQTGIINHMTSLAGDFSSRLMFTANGLSDTGWWGATTEATQCANTGVPVFGGTYNPPAGKRVTHGGQDIQPGNYPVAYRTAQCSGLINGESDIWEVYTNDGGAVGAPGQAFTGSNSTGLRQQITRFKASLGTIIQPPPPNPPIVTGFTPASGPVGNTITIVGQQFTGSGVTTQSVKFNGINAAFQVLGGTQISAVIPSGATDGFISVTTTNGTAFSPNQFDVTGAAVVATLGKVIAIHQARTFSVIGGDPGTVLTPVVVPNIQSPGPAWSGRDGKVYISTRPSAAQRPKMYKISNGVVTQISDTTYEANAIVPLSGTTDELGRVAVGTQGTGLLLGIEGATPAPPPPPPGEEDGSGLRIQIAPGNSPMQIVNADDWIDIGNDGRGMTITGGRQHELQLTQAGSLSLDLDNQERRYDPTNSESDLYGSLFPMIPIRVIDEGFPMFYGYVQDWGQTWPSAPHVTADAVVSVTAGDAFVVLSQVDLRSYSEAVVQDAPSLYWKFSEPNPTNPPIRIPSYGNAVDTIVSGAQTFDLVTPTGDANDYLEFSPGPFSGTTAIEFPGGATVRPLYVPVIRNAPLAWFAKAFEFWIWPDELQDGYGIAAMGDFQSPSVTAWKIDLNEDGSITFGWSFTGTLRTTTSPIGLVTTEGWHHIAFSVDPAAVSWYRDGVLWGTSALPVGNQTNINISYVNNIVVGESTVNQSGSTGPGFAGRLAHLAVYPMPLNAGQVAAHFTAKASTIPSGLAGEQINAILDMIGWPPGLRQIDAGSVRMRQIVPNGSALNLLLQLAETSERGLFQASPDGRLIFHDRDNLLLNHATPVATFGDTSDEIEYSGIQVNWDDQDLYNVIEITMNPSEGLPAVAAPGEVPWTPAWQPPASTPSTTSPTESGHRTALDYLSVRQYGRRVLSITVDFDNPADAENLALKMLQQYTAPGLRPVDLVIKGGAGTEQLTQVRLRTTHGDRVSIIRRPVGGGPEMTMEVQIEGRSLSRPVGEPWTGTFQLVPAATTQVWVLGVSEIGVDTYMGW